MHCALQDQQTEQIKDAHVNLHILLKSANNINKLLCLTVQQLFNHIFR